jgi:hypothetical protein
MLNRLAKWLVARAQERRARENAIAKGCFEPIESAPEDFITELARLLGEDDAARLGARDDSGDGLKGNGGAGRPLQQSVLRQ